MLEIQNYSHHFLKRPEIFTVKTGGYWFINVDFLILAIKLGFFMVRNN
jgi:hypothetical protein